MSGEREQRLVFGEVAEQYDASRPSYPDALFDTVMSLADLRRGDAALEIGAGTGKATTSFLARGLRVHCLEPAAGMAAVLRSLLAEDENADVEEVDFESWRPSPVRLVYAAQAWHWTKGDDRYDKLAAALEPGGSVALFWNQGRPHPEPFVVDNDAAYARYWPRLERREDPGLDWVRDELDACGHFTPCELHVFTWEISYTRAEWLALLKTHSDHQMIPEATRTQLHEAVGDAIDKHGGTLPVVYDAQLFFARKKS
jgi:SAM-dependent methyltransferase